MGWREGGGRREEGVGGGRGGGGGREEAGRDRDLHDNRLADESPFRNVDNTRVNISRSSVMEIERRSSKPQQTARRVSPLHLLRWKQEGEGGGGEVGGVLKEGWRWV